MRVTSGVRELRFMGIVAAVSALAWGCQLVGGKGSTGEGVSGADAPLMRVPQGDFEGFLEIEGGRVNGILTLATSGGDGFRGSFRSPPDLVASGRGRMRGREFRLELSYEGACPGRMTLVGRLEAASGDLTGSVKASDCTGVADGTFLFRPG
jgi:hypothetical protein